jgi:hypothetical protein
MVSTERDQLQYGAKRRVECASWNRPAGEPAADGWLPGGGHCSIYGTQALPELGLASFTAVVYDVSNLPDLRAPLADSKGQVRLQLDRPVVTMSMESSSYYASLSTDCTEYAGVAITMTTSSDATVPLLYFSWDLHPLGLRARQGVGVDHPTEKAAGATGKASALWLASNCFARNWRGQLVEQLSKNIQLDSLGACMRTEEWPTDESGPLPTPAVLAKYPFYLAFENTNEAGYVTEKVYNALDAAVVPVYLGAPDIAKYVPEGSILDIRARWPRLFNTIERGWRKRTTMLSPLGKQVRAAIVELAEALAVELQALINEPEALEKFHDWRRKWPTQQACAAAMSCMARCPPREWDSRNCSWGPKKYPRSYIFHIYILKNINHGNIFSLAQITFLGARIAHRRRGGSRSWRAHPTVGSARQPTRSAQPRCDGTSRRNSCSR